MEKRATAWDRRLPLSSSKEVENVMATTDLQFGEIQARADMLTPTPIVRPETTRAAQSRREGDLAQVVDNTLEDSFPASDPPSWTTSVARPGPAPAVLDRIREATPIRRALRWAAALF
jgi:hypothetical protein